MPKTFSEDPAGKPGATDHEERLVHGGHDQEGGAAAEAERPSGRRRRMLAYQRRPGQDGAASVDGDVSDNHAPGCHRTMVAYAGVAVRRVTVQREGVVTEAPLQFRIVVGAPPEDGSPDGVIQPPDGRQVTIGVEVLGGCRADAQGPHL